MNVFNKAEIIKYLYNELQFTQEEIARKLKMTIRDVGKVIQEYGFRYGKCKNKCNLREGENLSVLIQEENLDFLNKYLDENFEDYIFVLNK